MKNNKLTQKQENFVLNLFKGMSQHEAYINAGYSSNMLPATIDRNASALSNSNKIATRLAELREKIQDSTVGDEKERRQILTGLYREKEVNPKHRINAISEHNKMDKIYSDAPTVNFNQVNFVIGRGYSEGKELPEKLIEGEQGGNRNENRV